MLIFIGGCSAAAGTAGQSGDTSASRPAASGSTEASQESDSPAALPAPTPSYSQASGDGPAANVVLPVLPEVAKQETVEGFLSFVEYWFDLINYGYETGDVEPIRAISGPNCKVCVNFYEDIPSNYAEGGWLEGGYVDVENTESAFVLTPENRRQAIVTARQRVIIHRDSAGQSTGVTAGDLNAFRLIIEGTYTGDGWFVDTAEAVGW
ncbi:hypothetical protein H9639_15765 [Arthrobacter sp. Sa2CUA1]|uniref:DUF6318 domain-containing protein n=1 Tax=Arthrobacter gallicola TaxID=2762225 RepID=A0ABR8UW25_9MICC|nr:DUF6318 family protein [Arthrobacter gallicola]MBD7996755.1 hypothetical protein [Arthrobacter gallicola]